jgi:hypothetical protein
LPRVPPLEAYVRQLPMHVKEFVGGSSANGAIDTVTLELETELSFTSNHVSGNESPGATTGRPVDEPVAGHGLSASAVSTTPEA